MDSVEAFITGLGNHAFSNPQDGSVSNIQPSVRFTIGTSHEDACPTAKSLNYKRNHFHTGSINYVLLIRTEIIAPVSVIPLVIQHLCRGAKCHDWSLYATLSTI